MRPGLFWSLLVAALVLLTHLGTPRLWDLDEPRNAQCAVEMLAAGDPIVPMFHGELRGHKPALLYWLQMAAYATLGINEFAARLPSALSALGTVLLVYLMVCRLASPTVAAWSAVVLATSPMMVVAGRAATPDGPLIFTSTLAAALFVHFAFPRRPAGEEDTSRDAADGVLSRAAFGWPAQAQWVAIYAACALAVLAKGPIGLLLPGTVIGLTLVTLRLSASPESPSPPPSPPQSRGRGSKMCRWRQVFGRLVTTTVDTAWRMRPLTALATILLVAGPWYAAVGIATEGRWLRDFFLEHNVGRAMAPMENHSGPGILYYVAALLGGTFPWSAFAVPILLAVRRQQTLHAPAPLLVLGLVWMATYLGAFSLAATKLPSYITPCYPGFAMIAGWYLSRAASGCLDHPRWFRAGLAVAFVVGLAIAIGIALPLAERFPAIGPLAIAGLFLAAGSCVALALASRGRVSLSIRGYAVGAIAMVWALLSFGPVLADRERHDLDLLQAAFAADPQRHWIATGEVEPSWVFYSGGRIRVEEGAAPPEELMRSLAEENAEEGAPARGPGEALGWIVQERDGDQPWLTHPGLRTIDSTARFLRDDRVSLLELAAPRIARGATDHSRGAGSR